MMRLSRATEHVTMQKHYLLSNVAVWFCGSALVKTNKFTLRQTRLILGWVTSVCEQEHHLGI